MGGIILRREKRIRLVLIKSVIDLVKESDREHTMGQPPKTKGQPENKSEIDSILGDQTSKLQKYEKVKGTKLFQKFLEKELKMKSVPKECTIQLYCFR